MIVHAGLIALRLGGRWRGALIEGPSGSGKSDLAHRAVELGARLVADDRVVLWSSGGRLWGRAPDALAGLAELRGVGVLARPALGFAEVALVVDCREAVERHPQDSLTERLGYSLPLRPLWPRDHAAPLKLIAAMEQLGARVRQA